ncbi:MAG: type III pantothenate kinase [Candidatus Delongbacteria bacterium]|nr:type III pantothenate kinase [Candidatus Delongbacteria bacterium]MCG2760397.1 type III pantothenate kinase [Candidatus Delongbacteria bacterium]
MSIIIDIGNTSTKLYKIAGGKIIESSLFEESFLDELTDKSKNTDIAIASVVPKITAEITEIIKKHTGIEPLIIKHEHYKHLKSKYYNIKELGIDRLCNIAYAIKNYQKNVVVIDLGSAVTFDVINGKGEFDGGMILPGIKLQYKSLAGSTALLPDLAYKINELFIGRSTEECIRSGVQNGIAGVCNDFVKEITDRFTTKIHVVMSGGDAEFIGKLVDFDHKIETHTVPLGAYIISQMVRH